MDRRADLKWGRRWVVIKLTLIWCCLMATWIIIRGPPDSLRESALYVIGGLAGTVITGHLGFASWEGIRDPRRPKPPSPPTEPEEP